MTAGRADRQPVIIGAGLAGLMTALHLAPRPVIVLSKSVPGTEASSAWAQGGIAAAVGVDDDADIHLADTLEAGGGLCNAAVAAEIVRAGPQAIETLRALGACFDLDETGALSLGREAVHQRRRIVHTGDRTGAEILRAVLDTARRTPSITLLEGVEARRLITHEGRITGVAAMGPGGPITLRTSQVVIATGGVGGLYAYSTNPAGCFGQGLALAARAGAALRDMEFVQFHPTALDAAPPTLPLISEALRGDGAILVDETGHRFMESIPGAELAARDVVARAIFQHSKAGHRVLLDGRSVLSSPAGQEHFHGIMAICRAACIDPAKEPIPVRPAAHYHMGGISVDRAGRSTVRGLWACGEASSTGLHGANRLASNSLLEAAVCARWVAEDIAGSAMNDDPLEEIDLPPAPDPTPVRPILTETAGVWREEKSLERGALELAELAFSNPTAADPAAIGAMIALAALRRRESRGGHARVDYPDRAATAQSALLTLSETWDALRARH